MLRNGYRAGNYEVEALLGRGGMACVYRVRNVYTGACHALKVLNDALRSDDDARKRFLQEGMIAATLPHRSIVKVTEVVSTDEVAGLVMEYVPGMDLAAFIASHPGRVPASVVRAIFEPVLDAMHVAHEHKIVHRDIKPNNILLDESQNNLARVSDFGIAKADESSGRGLKQAHTATGLIMGTAQYMSPEQLSGSKDVTPRSDVFSLGATLYELATGAPAFDPQLADFWKRLVTGQHAPIPSWVDPAIAAAIERALFKKHVEQPLHADIDANAYAALKEIERAMRLGYEGCEESISLHHDPLNPKRAEVYGRPFSLCYLIDRPGELDVARYIQAIADASFLQVFSPILGTQAGEYDNYEKHQKSLALGHFTVHYATVGAALLVLPRKDIVHYAALRYTARALEEAVLCATNPEFRVDVLDPKFQKLTQDEQEKRIDNAFLRGVEYGAAEEEKRDEKSVYTGIVHHRMPDGKSLREGFQARLTKLWEDLDSAIAIDAVDRVNITEESPSITSALEKLRREITQARDKLDSQVLVPLQAELRSGRYWEKFFTAANNPGPLAQRYMLIALRNEEFLGPYAVPEENASIKEARENPGDLSNPAIKGQLEALARDLSAATQRGLLGRLQRENRAFDEAKQKAASELDRFGELNRSALKDAFWQRFHEELQKSIQAKLATFRAVAQIADESVRQVQRDAERFLADPASDPSFHGDATSYYLDSEALRDDRGNTRLWDLLFEDQLSVPAYFNPERLAQAVTEAFKPEVLPGGQIKPRDAATVVRTARQQIYALGVETYQAALEHDLKLDMQSALRLEAGYIELGEQRKRMLPQQRRDAIDKIPDHTLARHVRDKISRALESCVLLAQIDATRRADTSVTANQIFYVGLASRYASDEAGSLKEHLAAVSSGAQFVPSWEEPDLIVFYRALLGVPVYFFKRVNDELQKNYIAVRDKPNRSYPLHIDQRWEATLPNLDPIELRKAEEKRRAEEVAAKEQSARSARVKAFTLCHHLGHLVRNEDASYDWSFGEIRKRLAPSRATAFEAFWALDPGLREDFEKAAQGLEAKAVGATEKRKLGERLATQLEAVNTLYRRAVADDNDRDKHLLYEERQLLEQMIAAYGA